ncbi:MAG: valine--tRNA ligase [Omnitrophica WOR_2 bacterium RIFCSPLOWO2_12_FULL_51_8]|nr:MAG: valine--tRNA ligase [Omnitrophica WOR_2 bacterium RIFCSPLOWO2_12_FULL_51_8]
MNEIPARYNPKEAEDRWYQFWEERGLFSAQAGPAKKPFCIVIPPPNVTGILHMGHALNNTIQDILIRYHRMLGCAALWIPGTDHAGIATQNVVEKALAKEKLRRQDLGREKFIERVWQWREQYGSTIIKQLKKLGASCDWSRARFTMDEEYSKAVVEVFIRLFELGLIYRGTYIINWCPRCQTALSDEEAPHRELKGNLYYIKYPLVVGHVSCVFGLTKTRGPRPTAHDEYIVVATTRPETMLGDTAVAVNPKDKRYKHFIGRTLILPLVNREIKIIADNMVDMEFGTGAVKVTPAHDPNDYGLGKKHGLEFIKVMRPDGRMNENAADYKDMDRFEAREVILEDLKEKGLLEKVQPHQLSAGHCYRCHTLIEPYLSKQWFVKMKPLAGPAIEAVKKGKIKFYPKRWTKVYLNWMENIQDWCISRQIWWGHRLPVYYCKNCISHIDIKDNDKRLAISDKPKGVIASRTRPEKCPVCGSSDIYQDEDVLDTWFSSWLWPFATLGWPNIGSRIDKIHPSPSTLHPSPSDIEYFYPTSVLVTAPEIIFFWVARMIMAGFAFIGKKPFRDVYIHGTVRDIEGKKMSKSLGNIIDPLEIIAEYGADALRFSLVSLTAQGQDVYLSKERFEQGRNFANKIWNASRFILMNLDPGYKNEDLSVFFSKNKLSRINRWILSRFYAALKEVNRSLGAYKFNEAANLLYSFFWHEFCDWYLEMIKVDLKNSENQLVMYKALEKSLRALHPLMPFITEEIWQRLGSWGQSPPVFPQEGTVPPKLRSIMTEPWPHVQEQIIDKEVEKEMCLVFDVITLVRNMRSELGIPLQADIPVRVCLASRQKRGLLEAMSGQIKTLAKLNELRIEEHYARQEHEYAAIALGLHVVIPLAGVNGAGQYKEKLTGRIKETISAIKAKEAVLAKTDFIRRAPAEIVENEKAKLKELKNTLSKLKAVEDALK